MANAIKKISVQRGYDVTRYALNCFGGAARAACLPVADALGMKTVLIHPLSGCCRPTAWGSPTSAPTASRRSSAARRGRDARGPRGARRLGASRPSSPGRASRPGGDCGAATCATPAPTPRCRSPSTGDRGRRAEPSRRPTRRSSASSTPGRESMVEAVEVEASAAAPRRRSATAPSRDADAPARPIDRAQSSPAALARGAGLPSPRGLERRATVTAPRSSSSRTRRSWSSPAGRPRSPPATTSSGAQEGAAAAVAVGTEADPGPAGGLQQPLHVDRRADGRDAAEHRLFGQHQGAARLLLRGLRRRRRARRQRAAHAGASRLDGPLGRDGHPPQTRADPPGDVFALNAPYNGGTHLPDITVVHAGLRRSGAARSCSGSPRAATTPMSAARARAR
jgi:hypothetical protein